MSQRSDTPGTRSFGDWWRESPMSKSRPELYGICEAVWLAARSETGDMVPRTELEACNDDWNKRYQQWGETEDRLRAEIKSLQRFKCSVDEALNTGNGTYKP